jgi:hypothetical protein
VTSDPLWDGEIPARPYRDGTYGTSGPGTSDDLATDQHTTFSHQQEIVLGLASKAGAHGITGADVQRATGWGDSPKSRSMSNLLRDGRLIRLTERRDRGYVHVLPRFAEDRERVPYGSIISKHRLRALRDALEVVLHSGHHQEAIDGIQRLIDEET